MSKRGALTVFLFVTVMTQTLLTTTGYVFKLDTSRSAIMPLSAASVSASSLDQEQDVSNTKYDLAVIGGGVVGVQAALTAAQAPHGKKVILIDAPYSSGQLVDGQGRDLSLGGPTGLFSKALRDTSKRIQVATLRGMGLREDSVWNEILGSCVDLASSNVQDIERQLELAQVTHLQGFAAFCDSGGTNTLLVSQPLDGTNANTNMPALQSIVTIQCDKILLATGSQPFRPSGIPFDGQRIFDSDSINGLRYLPKSIAIVGSGIIAVEFAKIFRNLGAEVTLIIRDNSPRNALMKIGLDIDVAATLVADLVRSGIKIERGAQVKAFDVPKLGPNGLEGLRPPIKLHLEAKGGGPLPRGHATEVKCDAYLAAVGRKPNTGNLNLQSVGIKTDEYGGILVDSTLAATAKAGNVFAAGDVLGRPFLASTGAAQGRAAILSMFGSGREDTGTPTNKSTNVTDGLVPQCDPDDPSCIADGISAAGTSFDPASLSANPFAFPTGIWSSPEAAYYGLSTPQAKEMGIDAGESIALYAECLRGRVFSPNGLLKLVFEKPAGRILGVHICGDDACELIHYGMELVKGRRTIMELTNSLYSAVTFHEMYKLAAQAALDEAGARKRRAAAGRALSQRNRRRTEKES